MDVFFFALLFLYQTDTTTSDCTLPNCDVCSGDNCTQCSAGFFDSVYYGCLRCYLACFYCSSGQYVEYYKCGDSSCGCDIHNNFPSDRTSLDCVTQPQACYKCPPGYFHDRSLGSFCYKCSHPECKCTEANNCPECVAGKYNVTNSCEDKCPGNCMNCTDATICGDCVSGKYGISCEFDCINTCEDGSCDKILGKCLECPFGKYPDSSNNFGITFCKDCPERCAGCVDPNNCTLCGSLDHWGTTCQHDCTGCEGECSMENGCSAGCQERYYLEFSTIKNGHECLECQPTCRSCSTWMKCQTCVPGFWGSRCQFSCTGCASDCDSNGCSSGCVSNYYRHLTEGGYQCSQCPDTGYLAVDDVGCVPCSAIADGTCKFDGCQDGSSPIYDEIANVLKCVEVQCPETCLSCTNEEQCDSCKPYHWGKTCQYTCLGCSDGCFINNGCSGGCDDSYFQSYSETKKGYECLDCPQKCSSCRNDNECDTCEPNHWGNACQYSCSGCSGGCNKGSGCGSGCRHGYFQISTDGTSLCEQCPDTCSNHTCSSTNGTCTAGCENDWSGLQCDTKCSSSCLTCEQNNPAVCKICKDGSQGPDCKTSSASVPFVSNLPCLTIFAYCIMNNL